MTSCFSKKLISAGILSVISGVSFSAPALLVMPNCLEKSLTITHEKKAEFDNKSLVQIEENLLQTLAIQAHKRHCGGFMNVSYSKEASSAPNQFLKNFKPASIKKSLSNHYKIKHESEVTALLKEVEPKNIWHTLEGLTSFDDRYSKGDNGRKAAFWLESQFKAMVADSKREDVSTFFIETGGVYRQPSLVTLVGNNLKGEALVLGAHMDTLNYMKPGADDDGSGTSSLMETARVILNANKLDRPVYFIWYSAEEMGLIGSQKVVKHFVKAGIPVKSVLQFDMTGYRRNGSDKMWMIGDHVNVPFSKYIDSLIKKYIGVDVSWSNCGYACSDHASWTHAGYISAFPVESRFGDENPYIHTGKDTMEHVSLAHMTNFSKLGVAYVIEQGKQ